MRGLQPRQKEKEIQTSVEKTVHYFQTTIPAGEAYTISSPSNTEAKIVVENGANVYTAYRINLKTNQGHIIYSDIARVSFFPAGKFNL